MSRGRELMVGWVIIMAVTVGVVGTLWLQRSNFGRPLAPYQVLLESAAQLGEGNRVTYRGVGIGHVDAIAVEPGGVGVRVEVLLEEDVVLPDDAGVVLGPENLFGDWQAEIVSRALFPTFPFFDPPVASRGDTIVLGGYALPEITRLTASAEQISQNLADLTDRFELAFNQETANNLASAITNIERITAEVRAFVQQQGEVAANITANTDSAMVEIELAARAARSSFEAMDELVAGTQTDSIMANIQVAMSGLRELTDQLTDSTGGLAVTMARADSAFARVDRLAASVEAGEGSIGRLFVDSTFAIRAEEVLLSLDLLLQDVRENPRRYVRLSIF